MFQSKVAEHILLDCGRGSLHPELFLELLLQYATFIDELDRHSQWTIHLFTCVTRGHPSHWPCAACRSRHRVH
eukprot:12911915-Prorocentrum_lima.AAC.1